MAGIRRSARLITVKATCGHDAIVSIPPGELGPVGRERIHRASAHRCNNCDIERGQGLIKKEAKC